MNSVEIGGKRFKKCISSNKIQKAVRSLSAKINKDYKEKTPLFISVLNGSFLFTADLIKHIKMDCEVSFVRISSYSGTTSKNNSKVVIGLNETLKGRNVVILEDIVDSGKTLKKVTGMIRKHKPKSLKVATLLFKPKAFSGREKPDYIGIKVPNDFLVGYGLDYNGLGRNFNDIYILKK